MFSNEMNLVAMNGVRQMSYVEQIHTKDLLTAVKTATVRFPNSCGDYTIRYIPYQNDPVESLLNLVNEHHCTVIHLSGFTDDELSYLSEAVGDSIKYVNDNNF